MHLKVNEYWRVKQEVRRGNIVLGSNEIRGTNKLVI